MKQKKDDNYNQLILRVMRLMDEVSDLKQHVNNLNLQILNLTGNVSNQLNVLGKSVHECNVKQLELEQVLTKNIERKPAEVN